MAFVVQSPELQTNHKSLPSKQLQATKSSKINSTQKIPNNNPPPKNNHHQTSFDKATRATTPHTLNSYKKEAVIGLRALEPFSLIRW